MAVYNREKTIRLAIASIAEQLDYEDEILISDDESNDNTLLICQELAKKYPYIKILNHKRTGIDNNMYYLMKNASKDICIICDSDDVSLAGRVKIIKETFLSNPKIDCVYHNAHVINEEGVIIYEDFFKKFKQKNNIVSMFKKSTFFGACLAFRTTFGKKIASIAELSKSDLAWDKKIGFTSKRNKSLLFLPSDYLLLYRRWRDNASKHNRPLIDKVAEKIKLLKFYVCSKFK